MDLQGKTQNIIKEEFVMEKEKTIVDCGGIQPESMILPAELPVALNLGSEGK